MLLRVLRRWGAFGGFRGDAPEVVQGPLSPPEPAMSEPLTLLLRLSDRFFAPLAPAFTMVGRGWPTAVAPDLAVRALVLMLVHDIESPLAFIERSQTEPTWRRFLHLPQHRTIDAAALATGQESLRSNRDVREALRRVVGGVLELGPGVTPPFRISSRLVALWTDTPAGLDPRATA